MLHMELMSTALRIFKQNLKDGNDFGKKPQQKFLHMFQNVMCSTAARPPPPSAFKSCMKLAVTIIANTGGAKIVLTVPLPRYVLVACCGDTNHVSNRQGPDFLEKFPDPKKALLMSPQQVNGLRKPEF